MNVHIIGKGGTVGSRLVARMNNEPHLSLTDSVKQAHAIVLCVRDEDAEEAFNTARKENPTARIIDASAQFRTSPNWIYGLSQLGNNLVDATHVANPGCIATACILISRPLVAAGVIKRQPPHKYQVFDVSVGYSTAGKKGYKLPYSEFNVIKSYGQQHRHFPEIKEYGGINCNLNINIKETECGIIASTGIYGNSFTQVLEALTLAYDGDPEVRVMSDHKNVLLTECNGTNYANIHVANHRHFGTYATCVIDNLGKGSVGNMIDILNGWVQHYD